MFAKWEMLILPDVWVLSNELIADAKDGVHTLKSSASTGVHVWWPEGPPLVKVSSVSAGTFQLLLPKKDTLIPVHHHVRA